MDIHFLGVQLHSVFRGVHKNKTNNYGLAFYVYIIRSNTMIHHLKPEKDHFRAFSPLFSSVGRMNWLTKYSFGCGNRPFDLKYHV